MNVSTKLIKYLFIWYLLVFSCIPLSQASNNNNYEINTIISNERVCDKARARVLQRIKSNKIKQCARRKGKDEKYCTYYYSAYGKGFKDLNTEVERSAYMVERNCGGRSKYNNYGRSHSNNKNVTNLQDGARKKKELARACKKARQRLLKRAVKRRIYECEHLKNKDENFCKQHYSTYGDGYKTMKGEFRAPRHLNIPECVKSFNYNRNYRTR